MSRRPEDDADASLLSNWLRFSMAIERAAQHGVADLTASAWRVLAELAARSRLSEAVDTDTLGAACGLSPATTYRALADLEKVEYISRRRSNRDARLVGELELTAAGRHAIGRIIHAARSPS